MSAPFTTLLFGLLLSCDGKTDDDCGLQSTIPEYTPDCATAGVTFYAEETRAAVGGEGGYLVLYLPADVVAGEVYGGRSGAPLTAILTFADEREELATSRTSTIRVGSSGAERVELGLSLTFPSGELTGAVSAPVLEP